MGRCSNFSTFLAVLSLCVAYVFVKHVFFLRGTQGHLEEVVVHHSATHGRAVFSSLREPQSGVGDIRRLAQMRNHSVIYQAWAMQLGPEVKEECGDHNRRIVIRGHQYGQHSNVMASLAHILGLSEALNEHYRNRGEDIRYSLVLPNYMLRALHPFDTTLLQAQYCFQSSGIPTKLEELDQIPRFTLSTLFSRKKSAMAIFSKLAETSWSLFNYASDNVNLDTDVAKGWKLVSEDSILDNDDAGDHADLHIDSKMLFFWGKEAAISWRKRNFPFLFVDELDETAYYTRVYVSMLSALYGSVTPAISSGVLTLVKRIAGDASGGGSHAFRYSAAHRRNLNGNCSLLMTSKSTWNTDFDFGGVNMPSCLDSHWHDEEECKALEGMHPICAMPLPFVSRLNKKKGLLGLPIFLASDRPADHRDEKWRKGSDNSIFTGWELRGLLGISKVLSGGEQSCIDILLCSLGSGLFVGNPASTFTFQIYTLRALLRHSSLPMVPFHDLYFDRFDKQDRPSWISQNSVSSLIDSLYVP